MEGEQQITVRRAQAGDATRVAAFVNRALHGQVEIDRKSVITRLGDVGFLLAERGDDLIGIIGWHVENLVARVTDLLIWPARQRAAGGRALFAAMESAAIELQAEVALLLTPRRTSPELIEFCRALGYDLQTVVHLPQVWRDAAHEAGREDDDVMLTKQLRSEQVVRPL